MVDLAAKVKAIHELTDAFAAMGKVERIDAALAILQGRSDQYPAHHRSLSAQYDVTSLREVPEG
jgi:hypothetical protein